MFRNQHLIVTFSVALVTAALAGGCGDNVQATPRVTFTSTINPGRHTDPTKGDICTQTGTWFEIGSFGNPGAGLKNPADPESGPADPVRPVDDGGEEQQGRAAVSCSVVEGGDGFDVALHAELNGATGGAMTLSGHVKRADVSPGISLALTRKGETYSGNNNCQVTLTTQVNPPIGGGRIWATIECPDAAAPSQQRLCSTRAEFRFENCSQ